MDQWKSLKNTAFGIWKGNADEKKPQGGIILLHPSAQTVFEIPTKKATLSKGGFSIVIHFRKSIVFIDHQYFFYIDFFDLLKLDFFFDFLFLHSDGFCTFSFGNVRSNDQGHDGHQFDQNIHRWS